jgi:hypothetical protein
MTALFASTLLPLQHFIALRGAIVPVSHYGAIFDDSGCPFPRNAVSNQFAVDWIFPRVQGSQIRPFERTPKILVGAFDDFHDNLNSRARGPV